MEVDGGVGGEVEPGGAVQRAAARGEPARARGPAIVREIFAHIGVAARADGQDRRGEYAGRHSLL